jgi:hypothetical protein
LERTLHLPPLRHLAAATLLACATLSAQAQISTGVMTMPRMFHQASALPDGRILLTGGASNPSTSALLASTETYDPVGGTFVPQAPMLLAKREHAAITLKDGRVLVAGGMVPNSTTSSFAEIYNPGTGRWTATGQMNTAFFRSMALQLPDGRVMVAARDDTGHHAEIYDPASGTFSKSGDMVEQTSWHGMVVLADGRVLKMGGYTAAGYSRNAEIWDPSTNTWSATGQMAVARQDIQPVLLPDGKVLVAGGHSSTWLKTTEIYDPVSGTFSPGSDMPMAFSPRSSAMLGNGNFIFNDPYNRLLLQYQPSSGTWNYTGPTRDTLREGSITRLPDGGLLLAGGAAMNDATNYAAVFDQACASQQLVLDGAAASVPADGGSFSFAVHGAPGCRFEVSGQPAWLTSDPEKSGAITDKGTAFVSFTASGNMSGVARNASVYLANSLLTMTQDASVNCPSAPYVSPNITKVGYQGGSGTLFVYAAASCPWNISALPDFVSTSSTTRGLGNGSINYSVQANPLSMSRSSSGQLTTFGQSSSFTFTQDGPPLCPTAPTLTLSGTSFPAIGGTITATVSAAPSCPWSVSSVPAWTKLTAGGSGTGNGSFAISADVNYGTAKSGSGQVSGPGVASTFNLTQAGGACANWSISPTSISAAASGATGSIKVTALAGCNWSISGQPSWLALTSASNGNGDGAINYSIAPNSGTTRSAQLSLTGSGPALSLSVSQTGAVAPTCTTPISSGVPANGFLKSSGCPAGTRGTSYYADRYTFGAIAGKVATITLTSSSFDTYLYLRDASGNVVKSDDDGGGGTNSRISYALPSSGTYTIEVTSYGSYATGAYTLSFTQ